MFWGFDNMLVFGGTEVNDGHAIVQDADLLVD